MAVEGANQSRRHRSRSLRCSPRRGEARLRLESQYGSKPVFGLLRPPKLWGQRGSQPAALRARPRISSSDPSSHFFLALGPAIEEYAENMKFRKLHLQALERRLPGECEMQRRDTGVMWGRL